MYHLLVGSFGRPLCAGEPGYKLGYEREPKSLYSFTLGALLEFLERWGIQPLSKKKKKEREKGAWTRAMPGWFYDGPMFPFSLAATYSSETHRRRPACTNRPRRVFLSCQTERAPLSVPHLAVSLTLHGVSHAFTLHQRNVPCHMDS